MEGSSVDHVINFEVGEFVFDTIVLVSPEVTVESACKFILSTTFLMQKFAQNNMPLRGAIGLGDYCADADTKIFLSNIFKQLNKEEQNQQWSGCIITPDAEDVIISNVIGVPPTSPKQSDILHKLHTPSKSSSEYVRWCLNWSYQLSKPEIESVLKYMQGDATKQKNTADYINYLTNLEDDSQQLTPEFHPAIKLKKIKTKLSMQIRFEDSEGVSVKPGCDEWNISIF